jgi:hypothetical protein
MVDLFTARMQFAKPSTRSHFGELVEFAELWQRYVSDALPGTVTKGVVPSEEILASLYVDAQVIYERLQAISSHYNAASARGVSVENKAPKTNRQTWLLTEGPWGPDSAGIGF